MSRQQGGPQAVRGAPEEGGRRCDVRRETGGREETGGRHKSSGRQEGMAAVGKPREDRGEGRRDGGGSRAA